MSLLGGLEGLEKSLRQVMDPEYQWAQLERLLMAKDMEEDFELVERSMMSYDGDSHSPNHYEALDRIRKELARPVAYELKHGVDRA